MLLENRLKLNRPALLIGMEAKFAVFWQPSF